MKLILILLFSVLNSSAFADWSGVLEGQGQTLKATYENCDMYADFYLDRRIGAFEILSLSYSCAMPTATLYQAFSSVKMRIEESTGHLIHNGVDIGLMSDQSLEFTLSEGTGAQFRFDVVPGTAAWDTRIVDLATGTPITVRLW